jgi:hypothetical protein
LNCEFLIGLTVSPFSDHEAQRGVCEPERLADLVFDISPVGKMEELGLVAEAHERGRLA